MCACSLTRDARAMPHSGHTRSGPVGLVGLVAVSGASEAYVTCHPNLNVQVTSTSRANARETRVKSLAWFPIVWVRVSVSQAE